ncbi:DEAD/DEAH box helicase [Novipirellula rosea]|uniref:Caspase family protein n=1 Tax=Novipirellula rosea TaxID=1031540 RepID=A0ABP8M9E1_9BACT
MAFKSLFVGVGRHADPNTPDLPGPPRDARAMQSLFKDSLDGGEFDLLVDEQATTKAISSSLDQLFSTATDEDTLLFHFSGHGSENHDLIPHDIDDSRVSETTIPMGQIVELLRTSEAKNIICFLDCCFSGGVGAKVLTGLPRTRDSGFSFDQMAGEGRIIVAASEPTGEALECPSRNFGLLTLAIMQTLREAAAPLPVGLFCDELQKRVRAEAGRFGFRQEAVVLNQIAGGLLVPNLVPGRNYAKHFPDVAAVRFDVNYEGMTDAGIADSIVDVWRRDIPTLNELQLQSLNEKRLFEAGSLVVQAPTSSGKTFIGELASVFHACQGGRSLFLVPYKALATEKAERFARMYGDVGLRVIKCTGDSRDQVPAFFKGKYDIALMTYEMALSLLAGDTSSIRTIACIIIDEAHFVSDANRGISVELLMTLVRQSQKKVSAPQLLCLSAVSGESSRLHNWLGAELLRSTTRPVELTEGVLARDGSYLHLTPDGKEQTKQLVKRSEIRQLRDRPGLRDMLVPLVKQHIADGQSVLIFRPSRSAVKHVALYLAESLAEGDYSDILNGQNQGDPSNDSTDLKRCLERGTAFHSSNLAASERLAIERAFADPTHPLKVLAATTTMAAGVNTPADSVVIMETMFPGPLKTPFSVAEYKNMSGRAGRLGYVSAGRSIVLAEHSVQQKALFDQYVNGDLPTLSSSLSQDEMETWVLRLLLQIQTVPRDEMVDLLGDTFGGYLRSSKSSGSVDELRDDVDEAVSELLDVGMLDHERRKLFLTPLGRVCARSLLSYTSSQRIVKSLNKVGKQCELTELLAIVQCVEICDDSYTPYQQRGSFENRWLGEARSAFGPNIYDAMSIGATGDFALQKRCKRACLLLDWIAGTQIREIESKYTGNNFSSMAAGDIRRIADNTRLVFGPVTEIAALVLGQTYEAKELDSFMRRLEFGVPEGGVELTNLPEAFDRGDLLTWIIDGVHSISDLLGGTYRRLVKHKNKAKEAAFAQIKSESDQRRK